MTMNKNQRIALIAGAVVLAIVLFTSTAVIKPDRHPTMYSAQLKKAVFGGGVVAVFTFVAFIVLKTKD